MRMYNHSKNHSNSIEDECMALESDQHQDWTFCNKIFVRSPLARHVCMLILRQQVLPCIHFVYFYSQVWKLSL
jgi:hypothetical protein